MQNPKTEPPSAPAEIKLAIIEDQRKFREYLAALINGRPGFRCVGSYRSMEEGLDRIGAAEMPDVALVDIGLPGLSGIEGIRILKARYPELILLMLAEGHNYDTAAAELNVTTHTISFHLQRIYEKLHVHSKTEAVAKALRNRLIK